MNRPLETDTAINCRSDTLIRLGNVVIGKLIPAGSNRYGDIAMQPTTRAEFGDGRVASRVNSGSGSR